MKEDVLQDLLLAWLHHRTISNIRLNSRKWTSWYSYGPIIDNQKKTLVISEKLPFNNAENKLQQETEIITPLLSYKKYMIYSKQNLYHHITQEKFETLQKNKKVSLTGTKIAFDSRFHLHVHTVILHNRHDVNCNLDVKRRNRLHEEVARGAGSSRCITYSYQEIGYTHSVVIHKEELVNK